MVSVGGLVGKGYKPDPIRKLVYNLNSSGSFIDKGARYDWSFAKSPFRWQSGSRFLTLNAVIGILQDVYDRGGKGEEAWTEAMKRYGTFGESITDFMVKEHSCSKCAWSRREEWNRTNSSCKNKRIWSTNKRNHSKRGEKITVGHWLS